MIHHVQPIEVTQLFPLLNKELISLLRSLTDEEWGKSTIAKKWTVKDIAAHLLDTNLRTISVMRDRHPVEKPDNINEHRDLVIYLNDLNDSWVQTMKRVSPQAITDMLETTGEQYASVIAAADPWEDAPFAVAWAGEETSKNWFHIAREYTEKWIHQQQIRDAVGSPGIMTKELFFPFIDTFMCALPHTYKYVEAATGTSVEVVVTTDIGGAWHINKTDEGWVLRKTTRLEPNARITMDPETAWKLFSKGMMPGDVLAKVR